MLPTIHAKPQRNGFDNTIALLHYIIWQLWESMSYEDAIDTAINQILRLDITIQVGT